MIKPPLLPAARFLKPGEIVCLSQPTIVTTILGSCVAITLFHPCLPLGCICHAVYPCSNGDCDLKYVDQALSRMIFHCDRRAIKRGEIVTKLFGGANMFSKGEQGVGSKNVDAALRAIDQAGLRLANSDVGGSQGRKLLFNTHTGEVFLKKFISQKVCP